VKSARTAVLRVTAALLLASLVAAGPSQAQITIHFSPGASHTGGANSSIKSSLISFIQSATSTIEIAVYNLADREIIEALNTIAATGTVTTKVIVDDLNFPVQTSDGSLQLSGAIFSTKDDDISKEMHHKFVIIDRADSSKAAVWTGSANFNRPNLTTMNNNAVVFKSFEIAKTYGAEFDLMLAGKFHANKAVASTTTNFTVSGIPVEIRFAPRDAPMNSFVTSVGAISTSLYFAIFTFGHTGLRDAMLSKQAIVQSTSFGLFDKGQVDNNFTTVYSSYTSAGFNVDLDANPDVLHHKYAVLDGLKVYTGSMNFTRAGTDDNDENSVMIQDASVATAYLAELARISGRSIGSITAADWKESVTIGTATATPVSTAHAEPDAGKAKAIAYPNPFLVSQGGSITFATEPEASISSVKIFALDGRLLFTLAPSTSQTRVTWDGRTARGDIVASGPYFVEIATRASGTARGMLTLVR
jgi:hypothetical protein